MFIEAKFYEFFCKNSREIFSPTQIWARYRFRPLHKRQLSVKYANRKHKKKSATVSGEFGLTVTDSIKLGPEDGSLHSVTLCGVLDRRRHDSTGQTGGWRWARFDVELLHVGGYLVGHLGQDFFGETSLADHDIVTSFKVSERHKLQTDHTKR